MSDVSPATAPAPSRRRFTALVRGGLSVAILGFLFSRIPLTEVTQAISSAAPGTLLLACLFGLLAQLVIADRLRRLVHGLGIRLSAVALLRINLATVFYSLVLPAGNVTGIAARFYQMSRRERNYAGIATALAFERIVATVTLCVVGVVFWLIAWPADAWPALLLMLAALAALLVLYAVLFMRAPPLLGPARRMLSRWWPRKLASLRQAVRQSRALPAGLVVRVFGLGILTHGLGVVAFGLVAASLDLDLSIATIAWTRSAAVLIAILPISIAGLGVRESAMVVLLAGYGVDAADALSYSLLAFATTVLAMGLVGGVLEAIRLVR